MALRSKFKEAQKSNEDLGDMLDALEKLIDRTKVMYEQYFMGIQKMAPMQLHRDIERRVRELTQQQIRNTALRFRLTTLSQKFGSYNTYWKRTMRQIESGRYIRDVARVGRKAARTGVDVPPEIFAKMPRRMQERILRDRKKIADHAEHEQAHDKSQAPADEPTVPEAAPAERPPPGSVHQIDEDALGADGDFDLDAMFAKITADEAKKRTRPPPTPPPPNRAPAPTPARAQTAPPARAKPASVRRPSPRRPSAPGAGPPPGMSSEKSQELFKRYVKARSLVGEKTDNITYERLMHTLNRQAPSIMKKHGAKGVDFNVVIKGDKVVVKAKPIK